MEWTTSAGGNKRKLDALDSHHNREKEQEGNGKKRDESPMYYSSGGDRDGRGEDDYDRSRRFKQLRRESSRSYIDQHTSGRDYLSSSSSSATSASLQADRYSDRRATAPKSSAEERGYVEGRRNDYTSTSRRDGERERERERERDKEYDSRDRPRNGTGTRDYRDDESSWQRNSRDGRDSRRDLQREYGSYGEEERRSDRGRLARDSYSSRDLRGDLRSSRDERASDRSTYRSRDRDRDRDRDRERDSLRDRGRDRDRPRDRTDRYERGYDDAGRHNQSYSRYYEPLSQRAASICAFKRSLLTALCLVLCPP